MEGHIEIQVLITEATAHKTRKISALFYSLQLATPVKQASIAKRRRCNAGSPI
jgi:hypothetical protein